ncbi:FAD-dependent oxidoreductase [Weissella confusa]|uniref:FAD-dependent oxidoreductase n=1 Tax=Weissella confusa TaxID=1583 RepID=A0A923SMS9_WEICO|nr:FAD-dependent oxidoreductase [Weissella confusa]
MGSKIVAGWTIQPAVERQKFTVSQEMETTVPGVFAVGDVAEYPGKAELIATGFGEVPTAVNSIIKRIYLKFRAMEHAVSELQKSAVQIETPYNIESVEKDEDGSLNVTLAKVREDEKKVLNVDDLMVNYGFTSEMGAFEPRRLPEDVENGLEGQGIHYFLNDVEDFRDHRVLVAGGGDSAVDMSTLLDTVAAEVHLTHRRVILDIAGYVNTTGAKIVKELDDQMRQFQQDLYLDTTVIDVVPNGTEFDITTDKGSFHSKSVIVATGRRKIKSDRNGK